MDESVKNDVLDVLRKANQFLQKPSQSLYEMRKLSDHTIHNSSIFQDELSISAAILVHCLSKIIEHAGAGIDYAQIQKGIAQAVELLVKGDTEGYQQAIT